MHKSLKFMTGAWANFALVILLALLQGIAPLLHAHVHDISQPGKIHFHTFEFEATQAPADAGLTQLTPHLADSGVIGVARAGTNDLDRVVIDDVMQALMAVPFLSPFAQASPAWWFVALPGFVASFTHFLPPSQAPPGASLS